MRQWNISTTVLKVNIVLALSAAGNQNGIKA
jgi:hypothetical protein